MAYMAHVLQLSPCYSPVTAWLELGIHNPNVVLVSQTPTQPILPYSGLKYSINFNILKIMRIPKPNLVSCQPNIYWNHYLLIGRIKIRYTINFDTLESWLRIHKSKCSLGQPNFYWNHYSLIGMIKIRYRLTLIH